VRPGIPDLQLVKTKQFVKAERFEDVGRMNGKFQELA
jgi:hypothetical protein